MFEDHELKAKVARLECEIQELRESLTILYEAHNDEDKVRKAREAYAIRQFDNRWGRC
jgi:hypothetical protein